MIVLDVETTGFTNSKLLPNDPMQPYLVQLTMLDVDEESKYIRQSFNTLIAPDGWEIPENVQAIHGISTEHAAKYGTALNHVIPVALSMWNGQKLVGHNVEFDRDVISYAIARLYGPESPYYQAWIEAELFCTMKSAMTIVQARTVKGALKYPKLAEAYSFFFQRELQNAHSANADAVAALEIYYALQQHLAA